MSQILTLPLAALKLAPENARHACTGDIGSLTQSIAAEGLLDPLHVYLDGPTALVWDGGRRFRALKALAKARRLPKGLGDAVPVVVSGREAARRQSLVTFVREKMHPAQEFRAYKALFDQGDNADCIAAAMGVDARRVAQLLKLSNLAPEILGAFEGGEFGLDTAQAFTLADSHDRQRETLSACHGWFNAGRVRQLLRTGMITAHDRLARFVGREAYAAAGGDFLNDLFASDTDVEVWTDAALVGRLAAGKLDEIVQTVSAEGWAWVTIVEAYDFTWGVGFDRLDAEPVALSDVEQAEYDAASMTLEDEGAEPQELDKAATVMARLERKMGSGEFTATQKAEAGVFVQVDGSGQLSVRRGYHRSSPALGNSGSAKAAAKADPGLYGWGHTGHWHMTHIATSAVRHAILKSPDAAYDILVAGLAWDIATSGGSATLALKLQPRGIDPRSVPAEAQIPGETGWQARLTGWRDRLPGGEFADCLEYVAGLTSAEKSEIVALGVGLAMDAVELRFDQRRAKAWAQLKAIAERVNLDIATDWTPDAAFTAKGSKAALLSALEALGCHRFDANAKKADLVKALAELATAKAWVPALLQTLSKVRMSRGDLGTGA